LSHNLPGSKRNCIFVPQTSSFGVAFPTVYI
jgi:hypothetical protein